MLSTELELSMRFSWTLSVLLLGCPNAPKVMMEGGLTESFVEEGDSDGAGDNVDTGDATDSDPDENNDGSGSGDDGGDDGDEDGGDGGSGGADDGSGDGDEDEPESFSGTYDGVLGQGRDEDDPCEDDVTLYVDEDNSFIVEGTCDLGFAGTFEMKFEGSFDEDGEASGTFSTETIGDGETADLDGFIRDDKIELSAEFSVFLFGEVKAFFYTE